MDDNVPSPGLTADAGPERLLRQRPLTHRPQVWLPHRSFYILLHTEKAMIRALRYL